MENENTVDEAINSSEDEETLEEETQISSEDLEKVKAELEKEREARRQLTARAKKAEEELQKLRSKPAEKSSETLQEANSINEEAIDLRLDGYSRDEVLFILKNGGREALADSNSYVSMAINTAREQKRAEQEAAKAKDTSQMTEVEKKYSTEKLSKMSASELEKILPHTDS